MIKANKNVDSYRFSSKFATTKLLLYTNNSLWLQCTWKIANLWNQAMVLYYAFCRFGQLIIVVKFMPEEVLQKTCQLEKNGFMFQVNHWFCIIDSKSNFESVCHYLYVLSHLYQFCLKMYFCCTGTLATQLTVSDTCVWALNPNGEILCRYGISLKNPTGDYWRKVPGVFYQISGTLQFLSLWTILPVINF